MTLQEALTVKRDLAQSSLDSALHHVEEDTPEMMAWLYWIDQAVRARTTLTAIERMLEDYCSPEESK